MRKYMSKRQRPCDFCRARKTACRIDGAPPCRTCQLHRHECTFVESTRPRKRPLIEGRPGSDGGAGEGSTAAAETATSTIIEAPDLSPTSDDYDSLRPHSPRAAAYAMPAATLDAAAAGDSAFPSMSLQFLQDLGMNSPDYNFMFRTPRSPASNMSIAEDGTSQIVNAASLQHMASATTPLPLLDGQPDTNPEALGLTGDMDPYVLQRYRTDDNGVFKFKQLAIYSVQEQPFPVQFLLSHPSLFARSQEQAGHATPGDAYLRTQLEQLVPAAMGKRLISLWTKFAAAQYPIFSAAMPPNPETSPTHLLAAVYAVAVPFAMHDDKLCIDLAYDAFPYSTLSQVLNTALATDLHSPSLETVQTLLLLVLRPPSNPLVSDASHRWNLMGNLVTVAVNVGLHLDPASWGLPAAGVSLRRRLSFIIFSIDRLLAAGLGKPPLINPDNWLVTKLCPSDQLDSDLYDADWAQLLKLSSLTAHVDKALASLYSLRLLQSAAQSPDLSDIAMSLARDLDDTYHDNRHHDDPPHRQPMQMSVAICDLAFHFTNVIVHRAAMRPFQDRMDIDAPNRATLEQSVRESMATCTQGFHTFIKDLRAEDVNGVWPPWAQAAISSLCFAQLGMVVSASTFDDALDWIRRLQSTRKDLRLKAKSFPVFLLGLLRIDSIFWRGVDNVLRLSPHVSRAFASLDDAP
ncbi:putative transcriptional regulatory protein C25B8.11 [Purpureocillium lavendulum]|uniref:Transcriptional regulatory protein C25B8.11 n=1 Tax=Purpureocillium lavendulum TaxID=1247861 RepID=A0AB34FRX7_9HYPO|nr:putative transcriptional regulatory protein C25B8.11 [Purpureocillium lavendulum]